MLELGVAVVIALVFLAFMRASAPIGRDVSGSEIAQTIVKEAATDEEGTAATIIVFSDYRCPACRTANDALENAVEADGDARIVIREWPVFGGRSVELARIAIAAGFQDLHAPLHHAMMRSENLSVAELQTAFETLGGDWAALQRDLTDRSDDIDRELCESEEDALRLGLRGTPAFLTGTRLVEGAISEREFGRLIEQSREP